MTKDRIAELRQFQKEDDDSHRHNADDDANNDREGETVALRIEEKHDDFMQDFFQQVREMQKLIEHLREKVKQVHDTHTAIVSAPVADERVRGQLDDLMADIKRVSGTVRQKLKEIETKISELEQKNMHAADTRIRKSQHGLLLQQFIAVMNVYNLQQVKYRELCRDRIHRQLAITGQSMTNEELEDKLEKGDFSVFTQGIIIEKQQAQQMLKDIEARHDDIVKLETSIRELHDMFVELAMLVESQGEVIERIEDSIERTAEFVLSGGKELDEALVNQRKARKKKICIILIVVLVLAILALVITLSIVFS